MGGGSWLAGALVVALLTVAPAASPTATVRCPDSAPAGGTPITTVPWAQQRYAPQRLSALAAGRGVLVAVLDSGVDASHPQLARSLVPGRDLLGSGIGTIDCVSHGTAVASIIAAQPLANVGFRGLAPDAQILPVRLSEQQVLEGETTGRAVSAAGLAEAIRYAVSRGAEVINLSVVLYRDDPVVRAAVRHALDANVVVVAAVGNLHDRGNPTPYPAAYSGVLGVGAIGPDGARLPGSQVGSYVDIVAPGGQITAASRVSGHGTYEGTSFAAPFVSATAALVRGYLPDEPAAAVVRRILATADPAPGGRSSAEYGHGVLNPYRAVSERLAVGEPDRPAPLPAAQADPTAHPVAEQRARNRRLALRWAAVTGLAAVLTFVAAAVVTSGRRRRWRPDPPTVHSGPGAACS